jgi:rRNA processing protein Krr1/Pno1
VRNHLTSQNGGLALAIRKVTSTSISIEGNLLRFAGLVEKDVLETQHLLKSLLDGKDRRRVFDNVLKQAKQECEARGEVVDLNILQNLKFQK